MTTVKPARKRPAAKRAPRATPPPKTVSELVDGPVQPLNFDAAPAYNQDEAPKAHLFTLNETDYYVDAEPRANISLRFMRRYQVDPVAAQAWMLEEILGDQAYTALMEWDGLTIEHLRQLTAALQQLVIGGVEDATRPLGSG